MSDYRFEKVDEAEINSLLLHHSKVERELKVKETWIDYGQIKFARKFRLEKFYMNGKQFYAIHEKDRMWIRAVNSFAPCGWITDETINKYV